MTKLGVMSEAKNWRGDHESREFLFCIREIRVIRGFCSAFDIRHSLFGVRYSSSFA